MALIKCKECGNEVSNKAKKCPNCGMPIRKNGFLKGLGIGIIVLIFLGILTSIFAGTSNNRKNIISSQTFKNILEKNDYIVVQSNAEKIGALEYYVADNGCIAFNYISFYNEEDCKKYYDTFKNTYQEIINKNEQSLDMTTENGQNYDKFKICFPKKSGYMVMSRVGNTFINCTSETSYTKDYGIEIDSIYQQLGY